MTHFEPLPEVLEEPEEIDSDSIDGVIGDTPLDLDESEEELLDDVDTTPDNLADDSEVLESSELPNG